MNTISRMLAALGLAGAAMTGGANAATITVYNGSNPTPGSSTSKFEQALPGAGSIFATSSIYSGTYTGPINFFEGSAGTDTIGAFLSSAGGTFSAPFSAAVRGTTLSSGNFGVTTGLLVNFTTTYAETLSITHDDGVSIFSAAAPAVDLLPTVASAPTSSFTNTVSLAAGTYNLYYIEANGLPATLNVAVSEPASLALLGAGLFGIGMIRRRQANLNA